MHMYMYVCVCIISEVVLPVLVLIAFQPSPSLVCQSSSSVCSPAAPVLVPTFVPAAPSLDVTTQ